MRKLAYTGLGLILVLTACAFFSSSSTMPESQKYGANPILPEPEKNLVPTINVAPAVGWPDDGAPTAARDLSVNAFAKGLDHPRWLYTLPNGDVLVAETNAPPKPEDGKGVKGKVMGVMMKSAGAGVESANRITLLRDSDGDGVAETSSPFLEGLNSPFGMALVGSTLYVANTDSIMAYAYADGDLKITGKGVKITDLPGGPLNHHWTKNIIASADGTKLYATTGSNSNVGENGLDVEKDRALIWEVTIKTGAKRIFATGIRNPNGMAFEPETGALWTVVNERDELGNDLVPDYLTSVKDGAFYGWPFSYYGQHVDTRVSPQNLELVAKAVVPDYSLGAHVAALGLAFYTGSALPAHYKGGAFIGLHGSWNRTPLSGYKVVFIPFSGGQPAGEPEDVLTGFVNAKGEAMGRPVGVAVDKAGALLVADDVGNIIWRVH